MKIKPFFQHPEYLFAVIALTLGVSLCFLLPTGAGFDELAHLTRAIEISTREFIPNRKLNSQPLVPLVVNEVTYRSRNFYGPVEADFFERFKDRKIDWSQVFPKTTYSVYFPALYLPQAAVIFLVRRLDLSVLALYYGCRLAECFGYVLLCFLAIRSAPFGKWILTILALAPVAILQAASISTDPYSNGAAFLFIAWVLALTYQEKPLTRRQILLTLGVILLLFSSKVNAAVLIVLLALLPRRKFPSPRAYYLFLAAVVILFLGVVIAWNGYISLSFRVERADRGIWKQAAGILADPLGFTGLFFGDLLRNGRSYLSQWIAVNPNFVDAVPPLVYPLYGGFLLLTWLSDIPRQPIPAKVRWTLLAAFALSYTAAALFLYLGGRAPGEDINLNGRYLTIAGPALFLGLALPRPLPLLRKIPAGLAACAGALTSVPLFMAGIYLTFYVACGIYSYVPGLCILPDYRNLDPTTTFTGPVTSARAVSQEFLAECDSIQAVMVWPNPPAKPSAQATTYRVREAATGRLVAETTLPNAQIVFGDWYSIATPAIEGARGKLYTLEISSNNPDETTALDFSVSAIPEYQPGRLFIQGSEIEHDLYFHYGCRVEP